MPVLFQNLQVPDLLSKSARNIGQMATPPEMAQALPGMLGIGRREETLNTKEKTQIWRPYR